MNSSVGRSSESSSVRASEQRHRTRSDPIYREKWKAASRAHQAHRAAEYDEWKSTPRCACGESSGTPARVPADLTIRHACPDVRVARPSTFLCGVKCIS